MKVTNGLGCGSEASNDGLVQSGPSVLPQVLSYDVDGTTVTLQLDGTLDQGSSAITNYLYTAAWTVASWVIPRGRGTSRPTRTTPGLVGNVYLYQVTAVNAQGEGRGPNEVSVA